MPDTVYLEAKPGDLITAENWNELQKRIRQDVIDTTQKAVSGVTDVNHAKDSDQLDGKTSGQLSDEIVRRAVQEIRAQSGYQQIFTVLRYEPGKKGYEQQYHPIEHKLGLEPLVDVYRLDYFPVIYRRNQQTFTGWANFYLYNEGESSRMRFTAPDNRTTSIEIQPSNSKPHRIPWTTLLDRYNVKYDDDNLPLEDLVTDFWDAFLAKPNDGFDPDQYGESLWFQKCCDDARKVGDVKKEFDHLFLKMVPEKIAFFPAPVAQAATLNPAPANPATPATPTVAVDRVIAGTGPVDLPTQVQVTHFDFDTLGLRLLTPADYSHIPPPPLLVDLLAESFKDLANELKVMVLLKV
jgi:hypothetical protein